MEHREFSLLSDEFINDIEKIAKKLNIKDERSIDDVIEEVYAEAREQAAQRQNEMISNFVSKCDAYEYDPREDEVVSTSVSECGTYEYEYTYTYRTCYRYQIDNEMRCTGTCKYKNK